MFEIIPTEQYEEIIMISFKKIKLLLYFRESYQHMLQRHLGQCRRVGRPPDRRDSARHVQARGVRDHGPGQSVYVL